MIAAAQIGLRLEYMSTINVIAKGRSQACSSTGHVEMFAIGIRDGMYCI